MPKQLRRYRIYIASEISGFINEDGQAIVIDERNFENLNPDLIDDKVKIYERQVIEWFINQAYSIQHTHGSSFIVLMIGISYIEGVEQYRNGVSSHRRSRTEFINGLNRIFPENGGSEHRLNDFYEHVRCGLFHNGMSGSQLIIDNTESQAIYFSDDDTIKVNTNKFLDRIKEDFLKYIEDLRSIENDMLRNNFNRMFRVR